MKNSPPVRDEMVNPKTGLAKTWRRWLEKVGSSVSMAEDAEALALINSSKSESAMAETSEQSSLANYQALEDKISDLEGRIELLSKPVVESTDEATLLMQAFSRSSGDDAVSLPVVEVVDIDAPTELGSYDPAEDVYAIIAREVVAANPDKLTIYVLDEAAGAANSPYVVGNWVAVAGEYSLPGTQNFGDKFKIYLSGDDLLIERIGSTAIYMTFKHSTAEVRLEQSVGSRLVYLNSNKGLDTIATLSYVADASVAHSLGQANAVTAPTVGLFPDPYVAADARSAVQTALDSMAALCPTKTTTSANTEIDTALDSLGTKINLCLTTFETFKQRATS